MSGMCNCLLRCPAWQNLFEGQLSFSSVSDLWKSVTEECQAVWSGCVIFWGFYLSGIWHLMRREWIQCLSPQSQVIVTSAALRHEMGKKLLWDIPLLRRFIPHLSLVLVQVFGVLPTPDFWIKSGRGTVFYSFPVWGFYFLFMLLMVKVGIEKLFLISVHLPVQTVFMSSHAFFLSGPKANLKWNLKIIKFLWIWGEWKTAQREESKWDFYIYPSEGATDMLYTSFRSSHMASQHIYISPIISIHIGPA